MDNEYIAVGLSSPLSKSSFILFILGVFRTPKARSVLWNVRCTSIVFPFPNARDAELVGHDL